MTVWSRCCGARVSRGPCANCLLALAPSFKSGVGCAKIYRLRSELRPYPRHLQRASFANPDPDPILILILILILKQLDCDHRQIVRAAGPPCLWYPEGEPFPSTCGKIERQPDS
jgi:hypothetical protein